MGIKRNPDGKTATVTPGPMKSGAGRDAGRVTPRTQPNAQPITKTPPKKKSVMTPVARKQR